MNGGFKTMDIRTEYAYDTHTCIILFYLVATVWLDMITKLKGENISEL